jgi:hypothetical protein
MGGEAKLRNTKAVQAVARPGVADNFFVMDYLAGIDNVVGEGDPGGVCESGADQERIAPAGRWDKGGHPRIDRYL